jgi:hypothetical protein
MLKYDISLVLVITVIQNGKVPFLLNIVWKNLTSFHVWRELNIISGAA